MVHVRLRVYDNYPASAIATAIAEWVHSERDRRIIRSKIIDGLTFEHIAELEDMSPKGIQKIVYSAEDKLIRHLQNS